MVHRCSAIKLHRLPGSGICRCLNLNLRSLSCLPYHTASQSVLGDGKALPRPSHHIIHLSNPLHRDPDESSNSPTVRRYTKVHSLDTRNDNVPRDSLLDKRLHGLGQQ